MLHLLNELKEIIAFSQKRFAELLSNDTADHGAITVEQYTRFLSMQYHLTKEAYWYFTVITSHRDISRKRPLRNFLTQFAREEELHYLVAAKDIESMGQDIIAEPLDTILWHAYFKGNVVERPFIRLGAACILENISGGVARDVVKKILSAPFLTRENTRFAIIHQHETNPHGDQILAALSSASLNETEMEDLCMGARIGSIMYLRMMSWALSADSLAAYADNRVHSDLTAMDFTELKDFKMEYLEHAMP